MGFRYQKRIKLGKGFGLNVSKSGISPSYRTKYGSINPKGFSIKTGIPGLTYRGGKKHDAWLMLITIVLNAFYFVCSLFKKKIVNKIPRNEE